MRFLMPLVVCLVLPISSLHAAPNSGHASSYVESLGKGVIEVLSADGETIPRRDQRLRTLFGEAFGLPVMCRSVLGEDWGQASARERKAFCAAFEGYLMNAVIKVLKRETPEGIVVTAVEPRGDTEFRVTTRIARNGAEPLSFDWIIREQDEGFAIVDFVMGSVSLIRIYRAEFTALASLKGMDGLTSTLERKVAAGR